jgi:hypothetical protein
MTPQEKALAWENEVGKTQAVVDCKRAIDKLDIHMDKYGFTPNDLAAMREYKEILKHLKNKTT